MKNQSKVSIIIPAYNEENWIGKTLEFLKNQTHKNIEVVVVSNGSTDKTAEIAGRYTNQVYELKEGRPSKARNFGFEKSSGDNIVFLDADTLMENNLISHCLDVFDMTKWSIAKARVVYDDPSWRGRLYETYIELLDRVTQIIPVLAHGGGAFFFAPRENLEKLIHQDGYLFNPDKILMEDTDFVTRMKRMKPILFLKEKEIVTSSRRYIQEGYMKTFLKNNIEFLFPYKIKRQPYR
jgi:glycosyltransferase involved in cell wall biosynthesis